MRNVSYKPCKIRGFLPRINGNREKPGERKQSGKMRKSRDTVDVSYRVIIVRGEEVCLLRTEGAGSRRHYSRNIVVNRHANLLARINFQYHNNRGD
jgi:hypothetical protein